MAMFIVEIHDFGREKCADFSLPCLSPASLVAERPRLDGESVKSMLVVEILRRSAGHIEKWSISRNQTAKTPFDRYRPPEFHTVIKNIENIIKDMEKMEIEDQK